MNLQGPASYRLLQGLLFQLGWCACVIGGERWGAAAAVPLLALHVALLGRDLREWCLIACVAALGIGFDACWQALGVLEFRGANGSIPPPWLCILWLLFAGLPFHALAFLQDRLWLAALLGAIGGPLAYLGGIGFGAATSTFPPWFLALLLAPAWALLMPLILCVARAPAAARKAQSPSGPSSTAHRETTA